MRSVFVRAMLGAFLCIGEAVNFEVSGQGAFISNGKVTAGIGGGGFFIAHTSIKFREVTARDHCNDECFSGTDESMYCSRICRHASLDDHIQCYRRCMCKRVEPQFKCIAASCGAADPYARATHRWWGSQMKRYVEDNGFAKTCTCEVGGAEPIPYPDEL